MRIVVHVGKAGKQDARSNDRGALMRAMRLAESSLQPQSVTWVDEWENGSDPIADTDCVVVVGPRVTPADLPAARTVDGSGPPVVVVTADVYEAALSLRRVAVEEIVEGDPETIAAAIRLAAGSSIFLRAVRVVEHHPRFSRRLRAWLAVTLERAPPFATVKQSAKAVPWEPSTIRADWAAEIGISSPKEWLSMIQFARAVRLRRGSTWTQVARELGVSLRTLERRSQRVRERGLRTLADEAMNFEEVFEGYLAKVLTGPTPRSVSARI